MTANPTQTTFKTLLLRDSEYFIRLFLFPFGFREFNFESKYFKKYNGLPIDYDTKLY